MQEFTKAPRDSLTEAEVIDVIKSDDVDVDFGLELLDSNDNLLEDISSDFEGGSVRRDITTTVHGTCTLRLARDIQWHNQRLRPYFTLNGVRFNLGVYLPSTPRRVAGKTLRISVECYDKISLLNTAVGRVVQARRGAKVLTVVSDLIKEAGETAINLDQTSAGMTINSTLTWDNSDSTTYIRVINELLKLIGYNELWVDEDGTFRSEPHTILADRTVEWTYDAADPKTTQVEDIEDQWDFFKVPNKFVFINTDPRVQPGDDDAQYVYTNQSDGDTSVDARGRTITKVYNVKAANRTALILRGQKMAEEERMKILNVTLRVGPNPLHWHRDCVNLSESLLGYDANFIVRSWELPLNGSDMKLELMR